MVNIIADASFHMDALFAAEPPAGGPARPLDVGSGLHVNFRRREIEARRVAFLRNAVTRSASSTASAATSLPRRCHALPRSAGTLAKAASVNPTFRVFRSSGGCGGGAGFRRVSAWIVAISERRVGTGFRIAQARLGD